MTHRIRVTARDAARDFSRLLDRISAGAEAVIERHAEPVAVLSPVERSPRRLSECIAVRLAGRSVAPDDAFAADLAEIIRTAAPDTRPKAERRRTPLIAIGVGRMRRKGRAQD